MTGQMFIRKWEKSVRGKGSEVRLYGITGGKLRKGALSTSCAKCGRKRAGYSWGRDGNTHCVALTSMEMGTLGPLRMSALIHTGLRTFPASVSRFRRSREGPTTLILLKSSLIPVGRRPRAWGTGFSCSGQKELDDMTSWGRKSRCVCVAGGGGAGRERDQILAECEEGLSNRQN